MNKLPFIFLVFSLIINTGIHAQLGIYTGCNFSKVPGYYYPTTLDARPLIRPTGGVYYENNLGSQLILRWGLMYSPKGFVLKRDEFF